MVFTKWLVIIFTALICILVIYSWGYSDGFEDASTDVDDLFDVKRGDNDDR